MKQYKITYSFRDKFGWKEGYMILFGYDSDHVKEKFPLWKGLIKKIETI